MDGEQLFDPDFALRMPEIIAALSRFVADVPRRGRQWIFYGSRPLGCAGKDSDLDVLLLHEGAQGAVQRRDALWESVPTTVYVLTHGELAGDGVERRVGGYFSLKLFAPFLTDLPHRIAPLVEATAGFLAPFAEQGASDARREEFTADQLTAHAHQAFYGIYPDTASYLVRLRRYGDLSRRVWRHQCAAYVMALHAGGYILPAGQGRWRYTRKNQLIDPEGERARCAARFWAFGAMCHRDTGFPDYYAGRTNAMASPSERAGVLALLDQVASGRLSL